MEGQVDVEAPDLGAVQEEIWSGYRTRWRTMVEDVDDEDDKTSGVEDEEAEDWFDAAQSTGESDDEFTAISIWDELREGVLRAIGTSGTSCQWLLWILHPRISKRASL